MTISKKKQPQKKVKAESLSEFLSRGGVITKLKPKEEQDIKEVTRLTSSGPATILSLDEAGFYYGEVKVKKVKKPVIDLSKLPESLRLKFTEVEEEGEDVEEV